MSTPRVAVVAVLAMLALAAPASAHEGEGVLTVIESTPTTEGMRYVVQLTWGNDGDPALDSTLTATPVSPDGVAGTPVAATPLGDDGTYEASVALPGGGAWLIRFTSITPSATLEVNEDVPAPTTSTTTTAVTTATTEASDPTTTSAADEADEAEEAVSDPGDEGNGGVVGFVGIAVLVVIVGGVALGLARSARKVGERG